jgi:hypothetical protein
MRGCSGNYQNNGGPQHQTDGGSRKKLATAHRQMTCCAIPVRCKEHGRQGPGRDNVARGAPKGRMLERRQWTRQESSNGIRDQHLKKQLHLRRTGHPADLQEDHRARGCEANSQNLY